MSTDSGRAVQPADVRTGEDLRVDSVSGGHAMELSRRMRHLVGAVLIAMPLVSILAGIAGAVPIFSRKYQTSCSTCHYAFPQLNAFGKAFLNNGWRYPGGDANFRKDEPTSLGSEAYKQVWPNAIWPSDIPGSAPIAVHAVGSIEMPFNQPDSVGQEHVELSRARAGVLRRHAGRELLVLRRGRVREERRRRGRHGIPVPLPVEPRPGIQRRRGQPALRSFSGRLQPDPVGHQRLRAREPQWLDGRRRDAGPWSLGRGQRAGWQGRMEIHRRDGRGPGTGRRGNGQGLLRAGHLQDRRAGRARRHRGPGQRHVGVLHGQQRHARAATSTRAPWEATRPSPPTRHASTSACTRARRTSGTRTRSSTPP